MFYCQQSNLVLTNYEENRQYLLNSNLLESLEMSNTCFALEKRYMGAMESLSIHIHGECAEFYILFKLKVISSEVPQVKLLLYVNQSSDHTGRAYRLPAICINTKKLY